MVYIKTPSHNILIDAGLHQTNDRYQDFLVNNRKFKEFRPKDIDLIFLTHNHIDHTGLAPKLFRDGCSGGVIVPKNSKKVLQLMIEDCAQINERDTDIINAQENKNYRPLYSLEDTSDFLNNVVEFPQNIKHKIDEELSFELIPSGHLLNSSQIKLYITHNNVTKTLLFTGDLGNNRVKNHFVGTFSPVPQADIVVAESTYGDRPDIKTGCKERKNDYSKLQSIVNAQVIEMHGRVLIPTFAQSRAQSIAYILYELYKDNPDFNDKVYIDSPLAIKVFEAYKDALDSDERHLFQGLLEWPNL